jgi:DNA-binding SARP family transcriptional activator
MTAPRAKVRPPEANRWVVSRPRLRDKIVSLVERSELVWVVGTAGAGKTTAVADAAEAVARRDDGKVATAWLTVDTADRAPGRLLVHLEQSLAAAGVDPGAAASDALAASVPHVDVAALLAEAVGERPVLMVIDEVEHLARAATARDALAGFVRALGPAARVVLVSREDVVMRLGSRREVGGIGRVIEADLAFDVPEAARVLEGTGRSPDEAEAAVEATGGWVTGVLFEAWRSPEHRYGEGGEADALSSYLSSEIMDGLPGDLGWFLETTSLLDEVTVRRAEALGHRDARAAMTALRSRHIPVSFSADGTELRCHPRFRQFLRRRLDGRGCDEVGGLHRAHGRLLLTEAGPEDAVEAFLLAGDLDAAEHAGESAVASVLRRGDVDVVARWLATFRRPSVQHSEELTRADLAASMDREAWSAGAVAADRLLGMLRDQAAAGALDPGLAGMIGTCFLHVGRFDDLTAALGSARPGTTRDAWRVALGMDVADLPEHYRDRPPDRGEIVDGLLHRLDLLHGRFERLLAAHQAPWAAARSSRVAALAAVGRHDEALELMARWPAVERSPAMTRIAVDLLVDVGRDDEAFAAHERGRDVAFRSSPYCAMLHRLQEASLLLRVRRDPVAARAVLACVAEEPAAARHLRVVEQLELWYGLAGLQRDDPASAARHLRCALATMLPWDRHFHVPAAGIYLAEAEWQLGREDAADAAADQALAATRIHGTDHLLIRALHEYPSVLARRIDAERGPDTPWHGLGRVLFRDNPLPHGVRHATSHLREFGAPVLRHRGADVDPRLRRSLEVLAHLAAHAGATTKAELLADLFDARTDEKARSYLRQSLKRLRDCLPHEELVLVRGEEVVWAAGTLVSDATAVRAAASETFRLQGRARLDAARRLLAMTERGEYFAGSASEWILERRRGLQRLALDVELDAATVAFDLGELELSRAHVDRVLSRDPYRESGWRLSMHLAAAVGHDDEVIDLYRRCRDHLAEVPAEPAPSTRELLHRLRR